MAIGMVVALLNWIAGHSEENNSHGRPRTWQRSEWSSQTAPASTRSSLVVGLSVSSLLYYVITSLSIEGVKDTAWLSDAKFLLDSLEHLNDFRIFVLQPSVSFVTSALQRKEKFKNSPSSDNGEGWGGGTTLVADKNRQDLNKLTDSRDKLPIFLQHHSLAQLVSPFCASALVWL